MLGIDAIKNLPNLPGVYQMLDAERNVLYVGKAKDLKQRVSSYFRNDIDAKTATFMRRVASIEVIITSDENAALLLECNLIKTLRPHYNILFKDDKSFPYLWLSKHEFPRLALHRGAKKQPGKYFGPFPSAHALQQTLIMLQRIFRLRMCGDHFFSHRSRPCIQYQIKRCSAPCVSYIDEKTYAANIKFIEQFLQGKNDLLKQEVTKQMDIAAANLNYELAIYYRDLLQNLNKVTQQQYIVKDQGNSDYIAVYSANGICVVNVLFVRNGLVVGNKSYFPENYNTDLAEEVLVNFLSQHYLQQEIVSLPLQKIVLNIELKERDFLQSALQKILHCKLVIVDHVRGAQKELLEMALKNAKFAIEQRFLQNSSYVKQFTSLQKKLQMHKTPQKIECFDVSHTMGEETVASSVTFGLQGPLKSDYLHFNIKTAEPGDDYAALYEALTRRFQHTTKLPDILLIDGGKGQLHVAERVLKELKINNILLLAIAKGVERKPGAEVIYQEGRKHPIKIDANSEEMHLLQQIRDEAHRFALRSHRVRRAKAQKSSVLEDIAGIGAQKRSAILKYFGGLSEVKAASVNDLCKVRGINKSLAEKIYQHLHHTTL